MSVQAYFEQVQGVVAELQEYVGRHDNPNEPYKRPTEEQFTAIWQGVELLSRAYTLLLAQIQAEGAKQALVLPDVKERKATLYGPDGETPL